MTTVVFPLCPTAVCAESSFKPLQKQSNPAKSLFPESADSKYDKDDHGPTNKVQSFVYIYMVNRVTYQVSSAHFHFDYPGKGWPKDFSDLSWNEQDVSSPCPICDQKKCCQCPENTAVFTVVFPFAEIQMRTG